MNEAMKPSSLVADTDLVPASDVSREPEEQRTTPLKKLHSMLRGRYPWVVALTLLGAVGGVLGGYMLFTPVFTSNGAILINPILPAVLETTDRSRALPMFEGYILSQVQLIQSSRVLDKAMEDPEWKDLGRGISPEVMLEFRENLLVARAVKSQVVVVQYTDADAPAAQSAVKAVIGAYMKIWGEHDRREDSDTLAVLDRMRVRLNGTLQEKRNSIRNIASGHGSEDALTQKYERLLDGLDQDSLSLAQTELELQAAGIILSESGEENESQLTTAEMTDEQIATMDGEMQRLMSIRAAHQIDIESRLTKYGENHHLIKNARNILAVAEQAVYRYGDAVRGSGRVVSQRVQSDARGALVSNLPLLKLRLEALRQRVEDAERTGQVLGRDRLAIDRLKDEAEEVERELSAVEKRIDQIGLEGQVGGRIQLISDGDLPLEPSNSSTKKQLAVLGFVGGGGVGFGIILLIAFFDRRLRFAEDASENVGDVRMLGVLPGLPDDLSDPEQQAVAGYCVHYIRTLLQLGTSPERSTFAITSPVGGTGKTSLTLALGLSFAASGTRTLLVDCDLGGGGLTSRLNAIIRRRVGQILQRQGLISTDQLNEAVARAGSTGKRLGETLVEMGVLKEEDLIAALAKQEVAQVGLLDALEGEHLENCITETGTPCLSILPIGGAKAHDMSRLSPRTVGPVIEEARKRYDVILLDTGPIPGAIETSIVAAEADQVVLVVSRGEHRPRAEKAIEFLESIGAGIAGMVFNRAAAKDVARSVYSSATISSAAENESGNGNGQMVKAGEAESGSRYGPVAKAVADSSRSTQETS